MPASVNALFALASAVAMGVPAERAAAEIARVENVDGRYAPHVHGEHQIRVRQQNGFQTPTDQDMIIDDHHPDLAVTGGHMALRSWQAKRRGSLFPVRFRSPATTTLSRRPLAPA